MLALLEQSTTVVLLSPLQDTLSMDKVQQLLWLVLNGVFYNAATTLKPTFANFYAGSITPANSEDITAFVNDDPFQNYIVATDDAVAQSGYLETYDMNTTAGSSTTGKSSATLDIGTTGADNKQYRLLRSAEDPENDTNAAFRSVIVVANLLELQS
jgi:hypothetical protein